jgi:hypothetical protein
VSADRRLCTCILDTRTLFAVRTEVAATAKYFLAILDMTENLASLCIKFNFELGNFRRTFFKPTIRIRKNYSNVDGIEDYSNSRLFVDIPNQNAF